MTTVEMRFYETIIKELPRITKALEKLSKKSELQDNLTSDYITEAMKTDNQEFDNRLSQMVDGIIHKKS